MSQRAVKDWKVAELTRLAALPMTPFEPARLVPGSTVRPPPGVFAAFANNRYSVQRSTDSTEWGMVDHLWIRRHDGAPIRSWPDVQRIKREVLHDGDDRVGVEVYPRDVDVKDSANMYHLWVLPRGFTLPFALR